MDIDNEDIYDAMRSLFRYCQMQDLKAPDLLIDTESEILLKRIGKLNAHEIYEMMNLWPNFYAQQLAHDEIQNQQCEQDLEDMIVNSN